MSSPDNEAAPGSTRALRTSDFNYQLPEHLIAQTPLEQRTGSRLLHLDAHGNASDRQFDDLRALLRPGDLLVLNNTRVLAARLSAVKDSGGQAEILVERLESAKQLVAQVRVSKPLHPGRTLTVLPNRSQAEQGYAPTVLSVVGREGAFYRLESSIGTDELLNGYGQVPLPPYVRRDATSDDAQRYQTVFAERAGAVAAPTAGLHFDEVLLRDLRGAGIECAHITLHVGSGTFSPLRVADPTEHVMHSEWCEVDATVVEQIRACRGRVVAVGTTAMRALESAARGGELRPFAGETRLFITPGYDFSVVDALVTNFHVPESTLLMLVCAFGGTTPVLDAYRHAIDSEYRFFSYGDAMFIERSDNPLESGAGQDASDSSGLGAPS